MENKIYKPFDKFDEIQFMKDFFINTEYFLNEKYQSEMMDILHHTIQLSYKKMIDLLIDNYEFNINKYKKDFIPYPVTSLVMCNNETFMYLVNTYDIDFSVLYKYYHDNTYVIDGVRELLLSKGFDNKILYKFL